MQKRTKLQQQLLVAGCATMVIASTGCRSAMPKWNMFSSRNTPSAEKLAGNGPTITYPAPPSESATPDAIVSVAGGTVGLPVDDVIASTAPGTIAPVTGFDVVAANSRAGSSNTAAAQANGFNLASSRTPGSAGAGKLPGYAGPSTTTEVGNSAVPTIPVGYQFGTKKSVPTPQSPSNGNYAMPSAYPAPGAPQKGSTIATGYALPSSTLPAPTATPASGANGFGLPATITPPSGAPTGGFAMPDSMLQTVKAAATGASNAQPFTPKPPTATSSAARDPLAGMSLPGGSRSTTPATTVSSGASTPSFSTASASLTPRSSQALIKESGNGYAPGSTSSSGSYPTTSGYPSTGTDGSFYR